MQRNNSQFRIGGLNIIIAIVVFFLIFYLLASTKFLGFVDPATFILGGIEVGYFGLNLVALFGIFFKKDWVELPKNSIVIIILV